MAEIIRTITVAGFDPASEPSIHVMSDGSLEVWFEFMPPSDVPDEERDDLGRFAQFDQEMAQATGVPVVWEDREFFRIGAPASDTLERVQAFIAGYRRGT
jgi:hypothetical protein